MVCYDTIGLPTKAIVIDDWEFKSLKHRQFSMKCLEFCPIELYHISVFCRFPVIRRYHKRFQHSQKQFFPCVTPDIYVCSLVPTSYRGFSSRQRPNCAYFIAVSTIYTFLFSIEGSTIWCSPSTSALSEASLYKSDF